MRARYNGPSGSSPKGCGFYHPNRSNIALAIRQRPLFSNFLFLLSKILSTKV